MRGTTEGKRASAKFHRLNLSGVENKILIILRWGLWMGQYTQKTILHRYIYLVERDDFLSIEACGGNSIQNAYF